MKKETLICISLALAMILLGPGSALGGDNQSDQEGSITLTDGGTGPGVLEIPVARGTVVVYTASANAAAYGGTAGQVMCCIAGHPDANPGDAVYFGMRGSQMPDQGTFPEDNSVYQISADGIVCNLAQCVEYSTKDISTWQMRPAAW